jgi:hypothetical protein
LAAFCRGNSVVLFSAIRVCLTFCIWQSNFATLLFKTRAYLCHLHEFSEKPYQLFGASAMSKEQKSNKEDKKKPALSPKEKKAVKKSKKDSKS